MAAAPRAGVASGEAPAIVVNEASFAASSRTLAHAEQSPNEATVPRPEIFEPSAPTNA